MSGLICRTSENTLSFIARQFGVLGDIGVQRRNAGTGGELRDAEVSRLLSLAQAGQQGACGQIAPDQDQRAPIALDATIGKRRFMAEIEQAFMKPPA